MCGIVGIIKKDSIASSSIDITSLMQRIRHRGPDSETYMTCAMGRIFLGHTRLSIIDLTDAATQPMASSSGNTIIVFNGEIYNFQELRAEVLQQKPQLEFQSTGDTAVLIEHIELFGIHSTLSKVRGMYAMALYYRNQDKLVLVRDPQGEKPLYYTYRDGELIFCSTLSGVIEGMDSAPCISITSVGLYKSLNYIPAPYTIYEGINKTLPGVIYNYDLKNNSLETDEAISHVAHNTSEITQVSKQDDLEFYITQAVNRQLVADVPVGLFLSGGIDSSVIATAAAGLNCDLETFTIGFNNSAFDEVQSAKNLAKYLGLKHHTLSLDENQAKLAMDRVTLAFDEPFADQSTLPTLILCELARKHVKVALAGDGGDEFFAGYRRHTSAQKWAALANVFLKTRSSSRILAKLLFNFMKDGEIKSKLNYLLNSKDRLDISLTLLQQTAHENPLEMRELISEIDADDLSLMQLVMLCDQKLYLRDDILTKSDRVSMFQGLEVRAPLLDPDLVGYSKRIPPTDLNDGRQGKLPLRRYLSAHLPANLLKKEKKGFNVPIANWFRNELKDEIEEALSDVTSEVYQFYDRPTLISWFDKHIAGADFSKSLLNFYLFYKWFNARKNERMSINI